MTNTPTQEDLETRTCQKCGQTDTDPHHVQYVAFNHPVSGAGVDLSVTKHVDCCAEDGDPICSATMVAVRAAGVGKGAELRAFLMDPPAELQQELFETWAVESPDFQIPNTSTEEA
jgi:hypothetical protein